MHMPYTSKEANMATTAYWFCQQTTSRPPGHCRGSTVARNACPGLGGGRPCGRWAWWRRGAAAPVPFRVGVDRRKNPG